MAVVVVLVCGVSGVAAQPEDVTGLQFVSDNAATAGAAQLGLSPLGTLDGSSPARSVGLPAGFSVSQLAGGLKSPRFMTFDDAGNLLVADMGVGKVYRYPAVSGSIARARSRRRRWSAG